MTSRPRALPPPAQVVDIIVQPPARRQQPQPSRLARSKSNVLGLERPPAPAAPPALDLLPHCSVHGDVAKVVTAVPAWMSNVSSTLDERAGECRRTPHRRRCRRRQIAPASPLVTEPPPPLQMRSNCCGETISHCRSGPGRLHHWPCFGESGRPRRSRRSHTHTPRLAVPAHAADGGAASAVTCVCSRAWRGF